MTANASRAKAPKTAVTGRAVRGVVPRPFLKWAGGKGQLLEQLEPLLPPLADGARYVEPFLGSGALFFHLRRTRGPRPALLSDSNAELIGAYRVLRDHVDGLLRALNRHQAAHGEEHFYEVRATDPAALTPVEAAARLIYLNKTGYNGLYRVNSAGEFNVPFGRYARPRIADEANLRGVSEALADVSLEVADFREVVLHASADDFIYLDPPYVPVSGTASFTSYTRDCFGEHDQIELAATYRALDERGCRLMLSNSDTDLVRQMYVGYELKRVKAKRMINSNGARRGFVRELVVLNYPVARRVRPRARQAALGR